MPEQACQEKAGTTAHVFHFSAHAVIPDADHRVLALESSNSKIKGWLLPGGGIEPGETVHEALRRECREELAISVEPICLTGIYYHAFNNSQVVIFRCAPVDFGAIVLSAEHKRYELVSPSDLAPRQRLRVADALGFDGRVVARAFE